MRHSEYKSFIRSQPDIFLISLTPMSLLNAPRCVARTHSVNSLLLISSFACLFVSFCAKGCAWYVNTIREYLQKYCPMTICE